MDNNSVILKVPYWQALQMRKAYGVTRDMHIMMTVYTTDNFFVKNRIRNIYSSKCP